MTMTAFLIPRISHPLRLGSAIAGGIIAVYAAFMLRNPLSSMTDYTLALMLLSQIAPPLILLGLRWNAAVFESRTKSITKVLIGFFYNPWATTLVFMSFSLAVSVPQVFEAPLENALYSFPLGTLEFVAGGMFWALFLPPTRVVAHGWFAGLLIWVGTIPMTVVAVVWMLSPSVLYAPYLDIICRWNVPPIVDQKWAGFVMFALGIPLQVFGTWRLIMSS